MTPWSLRRIASHRKKYEFVDAPTESVGVGEVLFQMTFGPGSNPSRPLPRPIGCDSYEVDLLRLLLLSAVQYATSGELSQSLSTAQRYGLSSPQMSSALAASPIAGFQFSPNHLIEAPGATAPTEGTAARSPFDAAPNPAQFATHGINVGSGHGPPAQGLLETLPRLEIATKAPTNNDEAFVVLSSYLFSPSRYLEIEGRPHAH